MKRRTRVEGWALDVSDGEEVGYKSTLQKLGDNNRLWLATLVIVLAVSALLLHMTKRDSGETQKPPAPPMAAANGTYQDQEHKEFARDFLRDKNKEGLVTEAKFINNRTFEIVVPGETSADDIEYLSRMAAELHVARFKHWVEVKAYQRSAATGSDTMRATTRWERARYGFVVKFVDTK